jgi:LysM repeat protein
MQLTHLLAAGLSTALVSAKATNSRRTVACDFGTTADSGATCESFASSWGMSVNDLKDLNPGITCPNLDINDSYCVIGTVTKDPAATTFKTSTTKQASPTTKQASPTTTKAPSTTTETSGNTPQMPGLAEDCDGFHKIASGDQCDNVANRYGISVDQFRSWNSEVNDSMYLSFQTLQPLTCILHRMLKSLARLLRLRSRFPQASDAWYRRYLHVLPPGWGPGQLLVNLHRCRTFVR